MPKILKNAAAQFLSGLRSDYALESASHANQMAQFLAQELKNVREDIIKYYPETNVVILSLPLQAARKIADDDEYKRLKVMAIDSTMDANGLIRLTTHGLTTKEEIHDVVEYFRHIFNSK